MGEIWGRYGGDMGRSASPALPHRACAVQTPMQTLLARGVRSREAAEGGSREASRCMLQPTPRRSGAWRQRRHGYNAGMATAPAGPCARTGASGQRSRRRLRSNLDWSRLISAGLGSLCLSLALALACVRACVGWVREGVVHACVQDWLADPLARGARTPEAAAACSQLQV